MTTEPQHYGDRLRAARHAAGISLEEATFRVRGTLNRRVSTRTVGRLEAGSPGELDGVDDVLVVALCRLYGVEPATISPAIADRADRARLVLVGPPSGPGGDDRSGGVQPAGLLPEAVAA